METLLSILAFLMAIAVHECAHAYVADKLGDPTAKNAGRLTLNPLAHLDPIGTLMLIFVHVGWANPVPINPYNLKNPRRDQVLIALAGPFSNLLWAIAAAFFSPLFINLAQGQLLQNIVIVFIQTFVFSNVMLMVFNLLPFPPLDGSRLANLLLPETWLRVYERYEQQAMIVLIVLIVMDSQFGGQWLMRKILLPLSQWILQLL